MKVYIFLQKKTNGFLKIAILDKRSADSEPVIFEKPLWLRDFMIQKTIDKTG
jgi:hypothetical protein